MPIAIKNSKIDISSEEITRELAKDFSNFLKGGEIIFLYGEIGVGKTTFIRHLINNFQKKNHLKLTEVTSPTFNLVNEYDVLEFKIHHYDLFRLINSDEIKNIGLLENYKKILTLIEWPEKAEKKIDNRIDLFFEYGKDLSKRFLSIKGLDEEKLDVFK